MSDDLSRILAKLNKFGVETEKAINDTVKIIAHRVENTAKESIREPSQGRTYVKKTKSGRKKKHTASKPGDAPNVDEGRLIGSIKSIHNPATFTSSVGTPLPYGAKLELEMNRPWLEPALNEHKDDYHKQLEKVVDKQIRELV